MVSSGSLEKVFQDINSKEDIFVSARIQRIDIICLNQKNSLILNFGIIQ
jgi:hypothetical protein